jgi:hypothetical protein
MVNLILSGLLVAAQGSAIDGFKQEITAARSVHEKALAIQKLGDTPLKDPAMVLMLAPFLSPARGDFNTLLPLTAIEALSKFRGQLAAAQALLRALPRYTTAPLLQKRALAALGRVGHESALPVLEAPLKGPDGAAAAASIQIILEMPAAMAAESLVTEWERQTQAKEKASPEQKKFFDRMAPEFLKALQKVSEEKYTTQAEFQLWWKKHGAAFKQTSAEKESRPAEPSPPRSALPPILLVELLFGGAGGSTANTGTSSISHPSATVTDGWPKRHISTPLETPGRSMDFGKKPGDHAVDLQGPLESLKGLVSFTIAGWLNVRSDKESPEGNRVLSWLASDSGVELVYRGDGGLQLGINEGAVNSAARSAGGHFPVLDEKVVDATDRNWHFFAVTYDSSLPAGQVKFYFGSVGKEATLGNALDYPRGTAGTKAPPVLSVGHVPPAQRAAAPDATFRGLMDEVRIFGSTVDGTGALTPSDVVRLQNRPPPAKPVR